MFIPDANILLYATDQNCADHETALAWWSETLQAGDEVGLCAVVAFAFVRLSTNRRVFLQPLSVKDACARVENWLEFPNVTWLDSKAEDFATASQLLENAGTAGNLTTDAHIAAIAQRIGGTVISCDQDFARFPGINRRDPLR